jgi:hypothetical protein
MKIRTLEDFIDRLDEDLVWRRKEISYLFNKAQRKDNTNRLTEIRACVLFIYAHWEGFIKNASEYYLLYVKSQKKRFCDLKDNFLSIKFMNKIQECSESKVHGVYFNVLNDILDSLELRSDYSIDGIIKTNSNLTSKILESILSIIGFDKTLFELKHNLIDENLVKYRNEIAHGEFVEYEFSQLEEIKNVVVNMLEEFKDRLGNAATQKEYQKN